jgi:uncharacterized protein (TIGR03435 family)
MTESLVLIPAAVESQLNRNAAFRELREMVLNVPLAEYIKFAYKLSMTQDQVASMLAGLPKCVTVERFVIQARATGNPTKDQMGLMMQSPLAERFKLVVHFEKRDVPVLAMRLINLGKPGPELRPYADGPPCSEQDQSTAEHPFTCGRYNLISKPRRAAFRLARTP